MEKIILIVLLFTCNISYSQNRSPFYIGHSLVNHTMPYMVQALAVSTGKTTHYGRQIINGSPLHNNYNNSSSAEGTPYPTVFPGGNYNSVVVTEAVPLQGHLTWSDTYLYANNFNNYVKSNNNGIPTKFYIYETWHCINSGIPNPNPNFPNGCWYDNTANSTILWHPRLLVDFPLWSGIVTHVRNQNPSDNQIWMVPAGQAFYNLTTQINNGNVPGITSFRDLFTDDIHLTNAGNYFVACVMYATIYGESPVGLTANINNEWGNPILNMPTPAQALVMQNIAWSTVTNLSSWTGVVVGALPVTFSKALQVSLKLNTTYLTWSVTNQINNDKCIIEHSTNGRDFSAIGDLQGAVSSTQEHHYTYTHNNPSFGINYYRIKQIDYNGQFGYSNIVNVQYENKVSGMKVFPNPACDQITVSINDTHKNKNIQIYNSTGLLVKEVLINNINTIDIADLSKGLYFIRSKDFPKHIQVFTKY